jgi:hypothetical protein
MGLRAALVVAVALRVVLPVLVLLVRGIAVASAVLTITAVVVAVPTKQGFSPPQTRAQTAATVLLPQLLGQRFTAQVVALAVVTAAVLPLVGLAVAVALRLAQMPSLVWLTRVAVAVAVLRLLRQETAVLGWSYFLSPTKHESFFRLG